MATRATYQLPTENAGPLTLYVHWDGYPAGAAVYFAATVLRANGKRITAESFIRAVDGAKVTGGHNAHGDTEYQYTLREDGTLTIAKRYADDGWGVVRTEPLADFLNREAARFFGKSESAEPLTDNTFKTFGRTTVTAAWLREQARDRMAQAEKCIAQGWTGNASSVAGEAVRLVAAGADVPLDELRDVLTRACAAFPHMVAHYWAEITPEEVAP